MAISYHEGRRTLAELAAVALCYQVSVLSHRIVVADVFCNVVVVIFFCFIVVNILKEISGGQKKKQIVLAKKRCCRRTFYNNVPSKKFLKYLYFSVNTWKCVSMATKTNGQ